MLNNRNFIGLLILATAVYLFNMRLDVMEVDAAQYAEISWEMLTTKSFLQVHCIYQNYLDKPPLLFWLNSVSFLLFGVSNFTYRIPSVLFALLAVYSTYRFAQIYYREQVARMAAVMLATSQAVFLITNDVRTDTLLMGSTIFSIWQWVAFFETSKNKYLLGGSVALALALLSKGPVGLIATGAAVVPHFVIKGQWKKLADIRLLPAAVIVGLLLLPMSIGLYQQFGTKGLRFYYWTQSFGRITGESEWNNHPDTFFLVHTTAWAFAPWSLFFFAGWLRSLYQWIKSRFLPFTFREFVSLTGFTLVLLSLSLSKYQLPHYIFIVYPLAAVISARFFDELSAKKTARLWFTGIQVLLLAVLMVLSVLLQYSFRGAEWFSLACLIFIYPLAVWLAVLAGGPVKNAHTIRQYVYFRFRDIYNKVFVRNPVIAPAVVFALDVIYRRLFIVTAAVIIAFNLLLGAFYFPAILKYQPENDFGRYTQKNGQNNFVCYHTLADFAFVFYSHQTPVADIWSREAFRKILDEKKNLIVYTTPHGLDELNADHIEYTVIQARDAFKISVMNAGFLNPNTRHQACQQVYLLQVKK
jgi:4-amino-4-deoxy-L-arabinose transferase-like glycosyltransferase